MSHMNRKASGTARTDSEVGEGGGLGLPRTPWRLRARKVDARGRSGLRSQVASSGQNRGQNCGEGQRRRGWSKATKAVTVVCISVLKVLTGLAEAREN